MNKADESSRILAYTVSPLISARLPKRTQESTVIPAEHAGVINPQGVFMRILHTESDENQVQTQAERGSAIKCIAPKKVHWYGPEKVDTVKVHIA